MRKQIVLTCCLLLAPAGGSLIRGQVLDSKKGPVEFIGLEDWTPDRVQAKLGYTSDDQLHYCAADLKTAGFPEASVVIHIEDAGRWYTVVTVVEPKRAADVARRAHPEGEIPVPDSWVALRDVVQSGHLQGGTLYRYGSTLPAARKVQSAATKAPPDWWPALRERSTEVDYQKALEVLSGSKDKVDREVSAMVLMNFGDRDGAWHALAGALRDPDDPVAGISQQALSSLRNYAPKKVNWAPAAADLAAVLHGTNLFAFHELLRTLTATGIDPAMASPLLGDGGGRLVLAYLRAHHKDEHDAAHALLVQLRGADSGDQMEPWEAWLSTL